MCSPRFLFGSSQHDSFFLLTQVTDVLAAALHKSAELHRDSLPADGATFEPPPVLTTDERRQILHDRKARDSPRLCVRSHEIVW